MESVANVSELRGKWDQISMGENRIRQHTDTLIACGYLIANHNHSWLIKNTNVWSLQWADHELIGWTKWHKYFFIVSVINKHQNDEWLQWHSVSCARLLNIGLNTEVYHYYLKMRDADYRYVTDSIHSDILVYPTYYHVTNLVGLNDSDFYIYYFIWLYSYTVQVYIYIYIYIYLPCVLNLPTVS